ncbi:Hsp20/alpha crystallin family protein [Hydrococcus rivularis]|nr:Hsp20/alpha crystallin family protein [Hydrococcus rivularis]
MLLNENRVWYPPIELIETDTALILRAEIPGVKIRDLDVRTTKSLISITGKRHEQHFANEKELICSQLHYGQIECLIELPVPIQNHRVEAELVDGVLTVIMPKAQTWDTSKNQENIQEILALFPA